MTFTELDIIAIVQHLDADNDAIDMVYLVQAIEQYDGLVELVAPAKRSFADAKVDDVRAE